MDDEGCTWVDCRGCLGCLLTVGLTSLLCWLFLQISNPACSIQDVYIVAIDKTRNSTANQSIYLDLKLDNNNKDKGIYYDPLNITLHYYRNRYKTGIIPIANYTLPGFYQGYLKKTRRKNWTDTYGVPWDAAVKKMDGGGTAVFRVDLATAVRFKILVWKTKRRALVVGADLEVNDVGMKVTKKGTRLKSGAPGMFSDEPPAGLPLVVFSALLFGLV